MTVTFLRPVLQYWLAYYWIYGLRGSNQRSEKRFQKALVKLSYEMYEAVEQGFWLA